MFKGCRVGRTGVMKTDDNIYKRCPDEAASPRKALVSLAVYGIVENHGSAGH
jgi:hypothetical protein